MAGEVKLKAYKNCDDVQLFWTTSLNGQSEQPLPGCLGFMIQRQREIKRGVWGKVEILRNRVGFKELTQVDSDTPPPLLTQPSNIWPFQAYTWTDHGANNGDFVKYNIVAVKANPGQDPGETPLAEIAESGWTDPISVSADCEDGLSAYFNRGFVMSQFVARVARDNGWSAKDIKDNIKELEEPLRRFTSGELRVAILGMLDEVIENPQLELYACLFELADTELLDGLKKIRSRAHVVLANGADKTKGGDENKSARAALKKAKVDVRNRMLGSKGLGHNKFAIVYDKKRKVPLKAWTGSTNWAPTGLCTQANNGIMITNQAVAQIFMDQWNLLAQSGDAYPPELYTANQKSPRNVKNIGTWFTPIRKASKKNVEPGADIKELVRLVKGAKKMVLYVMFQPGAEPLDSIMKLNPNNVIVKGVVSTIKKERTDGYQQESLKLHGINTAKEFKRLVVPQGIPDNFGYWYEEVTRSQFLSQVGFAITHCKMIVIDPLDDDCVVITGSHNFSATASEKNDENFVVIKGNKTLAEAYSVACLSTYAHYRWRAYVNEKVYNGEELWSHLQADESWQSQIKDVDTKKMLEYWI